MESTALLVEAVGISAYSAVAYSDLYSFLTLILWTYLSLLESYNVPWLVCPCSQSSHLLQDSQEQRSHPRSQMFHLITLRSTKLTPSLMMES